jgi:molecular chaperone GrpE (heat shock protein)
LLATKDKQIQDLSWKVCAQEKEDEDIKKRDEKELADLHAFIMKDIADELVGDGIA